MYIDLRNEGRKRVTPSLIVGVTPKPEFRSYFAGGIAVVWHELEMVFAPASDEPGYLAPRPEIKKENAARRRTALALLLMATRRGFEPPISTVTGWHVRPLHHRAVCVQIRFYESRAPGVKSQPSLTP